MRKLLLLAAAGVCACSKPARLGGLIAQVQLGAGAKVSCADVRVRSADGMALGEKQVAFGDKTELQIGIGSEGYPRDVIISVQPLWSATGCAGAKPNGPAVEKAAQFPFGSVDTVLFVLEAPGGDVDFDRDGFQGVVGGGPDCNDADDSAYPGAPENCLTLGDLDCDGQGGCADLKCAAVSGCALPATQLAFTTASHTVETGACSAALIVESRNAAGAPALLVTGTAVTLAATPPQGVRFFSDATCASEVSQLSSVAPASRFTFYFSAAMSGAVDVTAASAGLASATQAQTVRPPAGTALAFATPQRTVVSGGCTGLVELEARDTGGVPRSVPADLTVALRVAPSAALEFYSDAACTSGMQVTNVTLSSGTSKVSFYVKGVAAGLPVMTASANGYSAATQEVTVNAGPPARLSFITSTQGIPLNTCSSVAEVRAEDLAGNPATLGGPLMLTLAATGLSGFTFHADVGCGPAVTQVPLAAAAGSRAAFYFRGPAVGAAMVTVSGGALSPALQTENIGVGPPFKLVFTTLPRSVQAGDCSPPVTVELQDDAGNPSNPPAPIAVTLLGTPDAGFLAYSDPACATGLSGPLMLSGSPSATFRFTAERAPSQRIDATAANLTSASQTHPVTPAAARRLVITTPARVETAGVCSGLVGVDVRDGFDNPVPVGNLPVTYSSTGTGYTFHGAAAGCGSGPPTTVTSDAGFAFRFIGTVAGPLPVTVSSGSLMPANQTMTINAGAASVLELSTLPRQQVAGDCSPTPLTLVTRDSAGNLVQVMGAPLSVTLAASDGGITFYDQAGCGAGAVTGLTVAANTSGRDFWMSGTRAGGATLTASAGGFTPATQAAVITAALPTVLAITSPPPSIVVNACSPAPVVFETRDRFGNLSAVSSPRAVSVDGGANVQVFATMACSTAVPDVTVGTGMNTASFHVRSPAVGTHGIELTAQGFSGDSQSVTVGPGVTITQLTFTTAAQTRYAGECSSVVTVQARDATNPVTTASDLTVSLTARAGFTFYLDPACATPVTTVTIAAGTQQRDFYFRGITGGATTLQGTSGALTPASQPVTIIAAVRTGSCTIASSQSLVRCPISPPLLSTDRSFLVFQTAPAGSNSNTSETLARCHLGDAGTIECRRGGSPGGTTLPVYWQTATLPTAVTVQHVKNIACANGGSPTSVPISDVTSQSDVFLLHSNIATGGNVDDNEHFTVRLSSNTNVNLTHAAQACAFNDTHDLQVVKLSGAVLTRGTATLGNGSRLAQPGGLSAAATDRTMLLYSWRTTSVGNDACERNVRGSVPNATTVQFDRTNNNMSNNPCADNGNLDLEFERVELPQGYSVQQVDVAMPNGTTMANVPLPSSVDATRTLALTGAQTLASGSLGETNLTSNDAPSHFAARFAIDGAGTTLTANRVNGTGAVRYTVWVVQLDPR